MNSQSLLRLLAVIETTGLGRSTIYKLMAEGQFPSSRKIWSRLVDCRHRAVDRYPRAESAFGPFIEAMKLMVSKR